MKTYIYLHLSSSRNRPEHGLLVKVRLPRLICISSHGNFIFIVACLIVSTVFRVYNAGRKEHFEFYLLAEAEPRHRYAFKMFFPKLDDAHLKILQS